MSDKPNQISIHEASKEQLKAFAQLFGLDIDGRTSADKIRELLFESGYSKETIPDLTGMVPRDPSSVSQAAVRDVIVWNKNGRPCFPIMIHTKEGKNGDRPVPVAVNGILIMIPRGKPVPVPIPYVFALGDAVQDVPEQDRDGKIVGWTKVASYPFQFVNPEELDPNDLADMSEFDPPGATLSVARQMIEDRRASQARLKAQAA